MQNLKKYKDSKQTVLPVMEQFYSLQGEGYFNGQAACFVRLAGCDVGCVWCDVKESWDAEKHPDKKVSELIDFIKPLPGKIVVVSGGEPLIYNLDFLCESLKAAGLRRHIETSGAYPMSGEWDWICLSPKKFKAPLPEVIEKAHELKIIVFNKSDFEWAETYAKQVPSECKLYLQPEWSRSDQMTPLIVDYVMQNPQWQISLQTHKFMDIE